MQTCISACLSNVNGFTYQVTNVSHFQNIHCKWPLEHSIQKNDFIHIPLIRLYKGNICVCMCVSVCGYVVGVLR
jgi:hypothetical protein